MRIRNIVHSYGKIRTIDLAKLTADACFRVGNVGFCFLHCENVLGAEGNAYETTFAPARVYDNLILACLHCHGVHYIHKRVEVKDVSAVQSISTYAVVSKISAGLLIVAVRNECLVQNVQTLRWRKKFMNSRTKMVTGIAKTTPQAPNVVPPMINATMTMIGCNLDALPMINGPR